MGAILKIDTREFQRTLRDYEKVSKRDLATILNTKGFYIARGAVRDTHKADKDKVKAELTALVKSGKKFKTVKRFSRFGLEYDAPLISLLINMRRGARGEKGLYGKSMANAVKGWLGARLRSIAFLRAGFIPAIKAFEPLAEKKGQAPKMDGATRQYGKPKGSAKVAKADTWRPVASITNAASAKGDKNSALERYVGEGLRSAFAKEVASMKQYMEEKFAATAKKFSAK